MPNGPSAIALPGSGKNFAQFRYDDSSCRQFAREQMGGTTANQSSSDSFAKSAVVGTALGAAIGAAVDGGRGAGAGAATGLFIGMVLMKAMPLHTERSAITITPISNACMLRVIACQFLVI